MGEFARGALTATQKKNVLNMVEWYLNRKPRDEVSIFAEDWDGIEAKLSKLDPPQSLRTHTFRGARLLRGRPRKDGRSAT